MIKMWNEQIKDIIKEDNKHNKVSFKTFSATGTWDSTYKNYTITLPDNIKESMLEKMEVGYVYPLSFAVYVNGSTSNICYVGDDVYVPSFIRSCSL